MLTKGGKNTGNPIFKANADLFEWISWSQCYSINERPPAYSELREIRENAWLSWPIASSDHTNSTYKSTSSINANSSLFVTEELEWVGDFEQKYRPATFTQVVGHCFVWNELAKWGRRMLRQAGRAFWSWSGNRHTSYGFWISASAHARSIFWPIPFISPAYIL